MEILTANGYRNVMLSLAHPDGSEVTWTINKVSWAPSLGHNHLSTIPLDRKGVEVFLQQPHIPSDISHQGILFVVADIIDNQYVVCTTGYFLNSTSDQQILVELPLYLFRLSIVEWVTWGIRIFFDCLKYLIGLM